MTKPEPSNDPWTDRAPGFLLGLTVGFVALAQLLIDKGVLDKDDVAKALQEAIPGPEEDIPHKDVAELWLEATVTNLGVEK